MLKAILGCAVLVLRWAMVGRLWGVWRVVVLELALAPVACGGVDSGFGVCSVVGGGWAAVFLCAECGGRGGSAMGNERCATGSACLSGNKGRRLLMGKLPC